MATGCLGKCTACWSVLMQMRDRGEWVHDPYSSSALWSFLIQDYRGTFWVYAVWFLMKKLLFTLVLSLTEGSTNAGFALGLQFIDSCIVLMARPHIGRDEDLVECLGAVSNFLACIWLAVPVIFQGMVIDLFSEEFAMVLALFSTSFAAVVSLTSPFMAAIKWLGEISNIMNVFGPAADGIVMFCIHIGVIAEGEMREKMNEKYMRNLKEEEKSVRIQLLLQTHVEDLTDTTKMPAKNFPLFIAEALGFSAHTHERKAQNMMRAFGILADVQSQEVQVKLKRGPEFKKWLEEVSQVQQDPEAEAEAEDEGRMIAFLMSQHSRLGAACTVPALDNMILRFVGGKARESVKVDHLRRTADEVAKIKASFRRTVKGVGTFARGSFQSMKIQPEEAKRILRELLPKQLPSSSSMGDYSGLAETTVADILIKCSSAEAATRAIKRLTEEHIQEAFRVQKLFFAVHVLTAAARQIEFAVAERPSGIVPKEPCQRAQLYSKVAY